MRFLDVTYPSDERRDMAREQQDGQASVDADDGLEDERHDEDSPPELRSGCTCTVALQRSLACRFTLPRSRRGSVGRIGIRLTLLLRCPRTNQGADADLPEPSDTGAVAAWNAVLAINVG